MRIRVTLDDELLASAKEYTGLEETSAVVTRALEAIVQREENRRTAKLAGTQPGLEHIPRRRRSPPDDDN